MKTFNELNETNSTVFEWQGIELKTIQDPYLVGTNYKAVAIDSFNNQYEVVWLINHSDFENLEDESEACDWDSPLKVVKVIL
jgi:hypothetical protein